jgi:excisionase family DNA binding protein
MKLLMRREEAREYLGVSDYTFRKLVSAGVLSVVRIGRRRARGLYRTGDLERIGKRA